MFAKTGSSQIYLNTEQIILKCNYLVTVLNNIQSVFVTKIVELK